MAKQSKIRQEKKSQPNIGKHGNQAKALQNCKDTNKKIIKNLLKNSNQRTEKFTKIV